MSAVPTGRFAPSPTGDLHLGNLRTALLAWLWSRHDRSGFLVRMEDLDRVTSSREHEDHQLRDLATIGLDWDGQPVRQSERFDLYADALEDLSARQLVYRCYCSRREIAEAASAPHGTPGRYPGTCRNLSAREQLNRERSGRPPALRLRADATSVAVDDLILGYIGDVADDVVLRRNDGVPAYQIAVVVDDASQGVGLVVRGDDLAPSTPAQVLLQRLLGLPTPAYAHVPLVMSERGTRLAKRDGAVTLADRVRAGDTPLDVVTWLLCSSGQPKPANDDPTASMNDLINAAAGVFDHSAIPPMPIVVTDNELGRPLPR